jgi:hypothetical protein
MFTMGRKMHIDLNFSPREDRGCPELIVGVLNLLNLITRLLGPHAKSDRCDLFLQARLNIFDPLAQ